jgi:glucoamylase
MEKALHVAFGKPGIEPRWTHSTKEGIGTAYHTGCRVWFTVSHGIVNEIYYPYLDRPNIRDLQFLITDGATFCHEEKRDLRYCIEYPERNTLLYRLTSTERYGRYAIIKELMTDPHASVLLMHVRVDIMDPTLYDKLRLFALLAPHIKRSGHHNSGVCCDVAGRKLFHAYREDMHVLFGCRPDFLRRSVGYVGTSDGWPSSCNPWPRRLRCIGKRMSGNGTGPSWAALISRPTPVMVAIWCA